MVVVLLVGLVALVATQIPLFTLSSWTKGSERLKLQRDAHYAMINIQHELRPASSDVSVSVSSSDPSTLMIDGASFVTLDGDPDRTGSFDVTTTDAVINVTLTLDKKNIGTVKLETAVKPRN